MLGQSNVEENGMREITCGVGEGIIVGGMVTVRVSGIVGDRVRLTITAPQSVGVVDADLYERARAAWLTKVEQVERQHDTIH
jgi:carbon storage regulator CsrA